MPTANLIGYHHTLALFSISVTINKQSPLHQCALFLLHAPVVWNVCQMNSKFNNLFFTAMYSLLLLKGNWWSEKRTQILMNLLHFYCVSLSLSLSVAAFFSDKYWCLLHKYVKTWKYLFYSKCFKGELIGSKMMFYDEYKIYRKQ